MPAARPAPPAYDRAMDQPAFAKRSAPILAARPELDFACPVTGRRVRWAEKDVFNPAAGVIDGVVHLLVRCEDTVGRCKGVSRLGLATSRDGLAFDLEPEPVLYPDRDPWCELEWEGGCEDPRLVLRDDGTWIMTYTAFDGCTARLCVATSRDLRRWSKHGPAFAAAAGGRWAELWSKSGVVVARWDGDRLVAARLGGRYWMYWGEGCLHAATSDDGIAWTVVDTPAWRGGSLTITAAGRFRHAPHPGIPAVPVALARPRAGGYDAALVEPGPAAVLDGDGIALWYNGAGPAPGGGNRYCGGLLRLDPQDPTVLIERPLQPFIVPDQDWELAGQACPTTFIEGLARLGRRELLYYGCADSRVAVAERKV